MCIQRDDYGHEINCKMYVELYSDILIAIHVTAVEQVCYDT